MKKAKFITLLGTLALTALSLSALAAGGGSMDGGGGGGLIRNGNYLTFGSAHVRVESANPEKDVPGLNLIRTALSQVPLPSIYRGKVLGAVLPLGERKYFKISRDELSEDKRKELIHAYLQTFIDKIPEDQVVVYAVTSGTTTYLLPEFYELKKEEERAAILFHESLWILNSKQTYNQVIDAEMRFQSYLENAAGKYGYDPDLYDVFDRVFDNPLISINAAAWDDFNAGRLDWASEKVSDTETHVYFKDLFAHRSVVWAVTDTWKVEAEIEKLDLRPMAMLRFNDTVVLDPDQLMGGLAESLSKHSDCKLLERIMAYRNRILVMYRAHFSDDENNGYTGFVFNSQKGLDLVDSRFMSLNFDNILLVRPEDQLSLARQRFSGRSRF